MTKYILSGDVKKSTKTKFLFELQNLDEGIETTSDGPEDWDNVEHIGTDRVLGDVFKAWTDGKRNDFVLYFGIKGDEFNN
jgi:hypothetical protein